MIYETKGMIDLVKKQPPTQKSSISVLIGLIVDAAEDAAFKQDQITSAWSRAGMSTTPNRFNNTGRRGVIELIVPKDIDREFAEQIAQSELGENFVWIAFDPQPPV